MNDVDELKQFAAVHARAQQIPDRVGGPVLARVTHDGRGEGSWAREWSRAAADARGAGDWLAACRLSTMARFPFVDGPERQEALEEAVAAFRQWRAASGAPLEALTVEVPGGRVDCWSTGSPARADRPFVILMGGIVSTKEQWAPTLLRLRRFGVDGLVTEMPRTGTNTLPYDAGSWRMLSAVLDAAGVPADGSGPPVYAMAMSFSGHLALNCALADPRIRGLITVGAPVTAFFTDAAWQAALPRVTVDTLAHLAGTGAEEVLKLLPERAIAPADVAALDLPVAYVASRRDEIIPAEEISMLRHSVRRLSLLEHDDVHASPAFTGVTGPWLVLSLLRMHGSRPLQRAALRAALPVLKAAASRRPTPSPTTKGQ